MSYKNINAKTYLTKPTAEQAALALECAKDCGMDVPEGEAFIAAVCTSRGRALKRGEVATRNTAYTNANSIPIGIRKDYPALVQHAAFEELLLAWYRANLAAHAACAANGEHSTGPKEAAPAI